MTNLTRSPITHLPAILVDCLDWMIERLEHPKPLPSFKVLRYHQQTAGVIYAWLRQGWQVEFFGSPMEIQNIGLALIAQNAGVVLPLLYQPNMLSEEQWHELTKCVDVLRRASIVFHRTELRVATCLIKRPDSYENSRKYK